MEERFSYISGTLRILLRGYCYVRTTSVRTTPHAPCPQRSTLQLYTEGGGPVRIPLFLRPSDNYTISRYIRPIPNFRGITLSKFADTLSSGKFAVTCELNPPKGIALEPLLGKALALKGSVDAFNLTDSAGSNLAMAPIGAARLLAEEGVETILQVVCRDRNRLALQSEILAASALGLSNILCMTGDPPGKGDHPEAKAVFDIDGVDLLRVVSSLASGQDFAGNTLTGTPEIFPGAVVNPGASDLDKEFARMEDKIKAGASFFQSQAVYDPEAFEKFMVTARKFGVPVLAGMIVLKSAKMARNLDANLPGGSVPQHIIDEMEDSEDRTATSIRITSDLISQVKSLCDGVHIMAIGWEARVPAILATAGLPYETA